MEDTMKKSILLQAIGFTIGMGLSAVSLADGSCIKAGGNEICGQVTLPSLNSTGNVILNSTTINGLAAIGKNLTANDATVDSFSVTGNSSLTKTHVSKDSSYSGFLASSNSTFDAITRVSADKVSLTDHTQANELDMTSNDSPVLCLSEDSSVKEVKFTNDKGTIYIQDPASSVMHADNAKIISNTKCPQNS